VDQPEDYEKESWQMDADEKTSRIPKLKEEGNSLYKANKIEEASEKYRLAVGMLEQLMLREKPQDEEWRELRNQKIPLLLNFAQCKLCQKDFYSAIEHCTEVIEADPENVKAFYRRAKANVGAWNPEAARSDFNEVIKLDPSLEKSCRKELKDLDEMEKKKNEQDKEKLKNLF